MASAETPSPVTSPAPSSGTGGSDSSSLSFAPVRFWLVPFDDNLLWDVLNTGPILKHSLTPGVVKSRAGAADQFD